MADKSLPFKVGDRVRYKPNNRLYTVRHIDESPKGVPVLNLNVYLENDGRFLYTKGELMPVPLALAESMIGEVKATAPIKAAVPERLKPEAETE